MAAATIAGRSTSTLARSFLRTTTNRRLPANFTLRCQTRTLPAPSPSRLLRRELSTLVPVHTAISAACLVSKLPSEANSSIQDVCCCCGFTMRNCCQQPLVLKI